MPRYKLSTLPQYSLANLPSPVNIRTGTAYEISDYGGNIATVVAGAWRFEYPFRTTWAGRPPVSIVPAGTELQVTDYANQKWISDGTYWRPAQGRVSIAGGDGNPVAVLSGVGAGVFTLPAITLPVGMLFDGCRVVTESLVKRTTSVAAYSAMSYIGTSGSPSDTNIGILSQSGPANACTRLHSIAVISADSIITSKYTGPHQTNSSSAEISAFNPAVALKVSFGVAFANVGDTFHLQHYKVSLEA